MPRGSLLALTILLLALAAGAASIWLAKPVYSARATVQIDPQASRIPGTENIAPDAARTEKDRLLQTQVDKLASSSTAQNVATKLNLANNPLFLREIGLEDEPAGPKRSAKVTAALQDRLSVSSPRDANIVDVRFDSHDPVAAARIANTFAETFISDSLKRRRGRSGLLAPLPPRPGRSDKARLEQVGAQSGELRPFRAAAPPPRRRARPSSTRLIRWPRPTGCRRSSAGSAGSGPSPLRR